MTSDTPRFRLGIIAVVALSLFAALFARLWYLQVLSAPDFRLQAQANSIRTVDDPAPRGRILDRNGKVIVDNRASNVVAIDRSKLPKEDEPKLLQRLSAILGDSTHALKERLESQRVSPYTPVPVAEDVSEDKMVRLLERADDFPAVVAKRVAVRSYPMGNLAGHLLGYVGEVTQEDIEASGGEYELGDQIGKAGIERVYEKDLRGKAGELKIEVDSKGRPIRVVSHRSPVQGDDIVLSINADVQRTAEEGLAEGLASARGQRFRDDRRPLVADAGAVVVLDTRGYVEALASNPTFDLPGLADGISTEEAKTLFSASSGAPFTDRAIQGQYAPGSTWKLITADAALRNGLITPNFSLVDSGTYTIPGDCTGRGCLRHNAASRAYGRVGVSRALTVSSDVFFYTLGANFWIERQRFGESPIQDQAMRYGFGAATGIPLPFESAGRVLTPKSKQALHDKNPKLAAAGWYTGNNVNLSIGQESMLVTPVQIANAYATFANGGTRYSPNVALRVQRSNGKPVREITPRVSERLDLPPSVRDPILAGLIGAVSDESGTAYNAFLGFPLAQWGVAGKTGTAQATPKQDTALFVGFGPIAAPEHVVAVVMEQAGFGATSAAPVARKIFGVLSGLELQEPPVQFVQQTQPGD
jgi:penicillin-binding protein 2